MGFPGNFASRNPFMRPEAMIASTSVMSLWREKAITNRALAENLRLLCSYYPSVSEVCRRLDINRQQFNKYLAGHTRPSNHNMRRICDFFDVEESDLLLPHDTFSGITDQNRSNKHGLQNLPRHLQHIEALRRLSGNSLNPYLGYYYRYFYSYGFPGRIVRSLFGIFQKEGVYYSKNIGILSGYHEERPFTIRFKYIGLPLLLNNRIFLIEYEPIVKDMVSETILYPAHRNQLDILSGIQCTIAGQRSRAPAAGKVLFEFLGREVNPYKAMKSCGLFDASEGFVPDSIIQMLGSHIDEDDHTLLVL